MTSEALNSMDRKRQFRGCLLGGAVGDALGAPIEFFSYQEICRYFGPLGLSDLEPAYGRLGAITDDTQMTLFTAEGLLRGYLRSQERGLPPAYVSTVAHAYLRWYLTQAGEKNDVEAWNLVSGGGPDGWLLDHKELWSLRGPGRTCMTSLRALNDFNTLAENNSKGCGGVMRVAPIALHLTEFVPSYQPNLDEDARRWHLSEFGQVFNLARQISGITHGHVTGQLAAGAFTELLLRVVMGWPLLDAIDCTLEQLELVEGHEETSEAITTAVDLAQGGQEPSPDQVASLGEGWTAEEALSIALYCTLVSESFEEGVLLAVNHGGDSDSTGAIAGNLLGAMFGEEAIRSDWLEKLELVELIREMADDLERAPRWLIASINDMCPGPEPTDEYTDLAYDRYPPW